MDNLNRAINVADIAVNATPQDYPNRATMLNNLRILLGTRFKQTRLMDNLNHTVNITNIAVNTTPQDHPN